MKVTLNEVIQKAYQNQGFLNQLVRDPVRAVKRAGLELSGPDLKILKRKLEQQYRISGKNILRYFSAFFVTEKTKPGPPPPWTQRLQPPKEFRVIK